MAVISTLGIPRAQGGGIISFEWVPSPTVIANQLEAAADYLENMRPPITLSREAFIEGVHEAFSTQGGSIGESWAPWAESYAPYAMAHNIGGILQQTLAMERGVTDRGSYTIAARALFFHGGAAPDRWIWHQEGAQRSTGGLGKMSKADLQRHFIRTARSHGIEAAKAQHAALGQIGTNTLPARPFIGMSPATEGKIITIFEDWFSGALVGATSTGQPIIRTPRGASFAPRY